MRKFLAVPAILAAFALTACGENFQDAATQNVQTGPAQVIAFPDGFGNVASKCDDHGFRVYSLSRSHGSDSLPGAVAVAADPACK